jgi:D-glycero-D-manno-heptose 1,7-bisphosphate phosphatase
VSKAIFLDRDGVLNEVKLKDGKPYPPDNINELYLLPRVTDALCLLKDLGYLLIVITNQPDVQRGKIKKESVQAINEFLNKLLPLDDIYTCYHTDFENCNCRKPKPGNILDAAIKYNINLQESFMVGDRWRDIEAGKNAGCRTFFIDYEYKEKKPKNFTYKVKSLYEAAKIVSDIR